jgi:hypothetical protein
LDSLPHGEPSYARLALARAEQLLRAHDDQGARALLSQIAQAHPELSRAVRRHEAMSWPRVGRVTLADAGENRTRLRRAFWLDGSSFVYARIVPPEHAGRLTLEAQIQASLLLPGVAPALAHGVGDDGRAFAVISTRAKPIERSWIDDLSLTDALTLAFEALRILRALASSGVELPDASLDRFMLERGGPHGLRLVDFDGAKRSDPAAAAIAHGALARSFAQEVLAQRPDLPATIHLRIRGNTPLPVLGRIFTEHLAHEPE